MGRLIAQLDFGFWTRLRCLVAGHQWQSIRQDMCQCRRCGWLTDHEWPPPLRWWKPEAMMKNSTETD